MNVAIPPGVTIPIDFPPASYWPAWYYAPTEEDKAERQKAEDQADAIIAALNTPYFPVLRNLHHTNINKALAQWQ